MPRWLWFTPLALLIGATGIIGFRLGLTAATVTETDVIEAIAAEYMTAAGKGAARTDCAARPGSTRGVWIRVRCLSPEGVWFDYAADRFGSLVDVPAHQKPDAELNI
ncbi:hypothetical protein [Roseobacter ponti]|uniref:Uncharacterized protein n=1 Tax=Roseobacter ponti TaxID=1891787 RepID=A0A858SS72_9RHOB|nr:hypothetical protein [Roseobacter ponti]QJF50837.1 hypothetical protein G3256_06535 [Roseobacter ponti]